MVFITGSAGFIGFHLSRRLLQEGENIIGYDNVNDYYDVNLKEARLTILKKYKNFIFYKGNLENEEKLKKIMKENKIDIIIHLAAQAGVRYSLINPKAYLKSNLVGFLNILECCRHNEVKHLIFASSSSVYGANTKIPFSVHHNVDHPVSLYAATKKSNELMAHAYSSLYNIRCTGLRFFTVYGPWGRPDMALFLFTKAILNNETIKVFNYGKMMRDFTYIDDIIEGIIRLINKIPQVNTKWDSSNPDPGTSYAPYKIYNIGNNQPVELLYFIEVLEKKLGRKAKKELLPMQQGDVKETYAEVNDLINDVGFRPNTTIEKGIGEFVRWYKEYYHLSDS